MPRSRGNGGHETSDESGTLKLNIRLTSSIVSLVVFTTLEVEVAPSLINDVQQERLLIVCPFRRGGEGFSGPKPRQTEIVSVLR